MKMHRAMVIAREIPPITISRLEGFLLPALNDDIPTMRSEF